MTAPAQPRIKNALAAGILTAFAAFATSAQAQTSEAVHKIHISAQPLATALVELSRQTDVVIVAPAELIEGKQAPTISGVLLPAEALDKLLNGSGLHYSRGIEGEITIVDKATLAKRDQTADASMLSTRLMLAKADSSSQSSSSADASASARGQTEDSSAKLEEIVVTATKRNERAFDIPISITALGAEEISRRGLVNAADYLRGIPGVNQVEGGFGQSIVIRGIETSTHLQNFGSGPTTATYFGETPTTDSGTLAANTNLDIKLVDIERVEVLRGPQGTAYGSSSMGGAVRTIPVAPKLDRFEGKIATGYSFTSGTGGDNQMINAVANVPLIAGRLAVRATAYKFDDSGFYRNRSSSDPAFQTAIVEPYGTQAFTGGDRDEVGASSAMGARVAALFQATDALSFAFNYLTQKTEIDGWRFTKTWAGSESAPYDQSFLLVAREHVRRGQSGGFSDGDIDIANAVVDYDLGWGNLLASYSHIDSSALYAFSYTMVSDWAFSTLGDGGHRQHVGEIRLATKSDRAWQFLAGLYGEKLDDEVQWNYLWTGALDRDFFAPGQQFLGDIFDRRALKQKAAFGEVSWKILPQLTLTGGVRAYDYQRDVDVYTNGPLVSTNSSHLEVDASGNTFRGNLSYRPNDKALVYAGWAQGFRLGKPEAGLPPGLCDLDNDGIVDGTNTTIESTKTTSSDAVDSFELGGKFTLLDRRVKIDATAFRMKWSDMPVTVGTGCGISYNTNGGKALSEGVELQASFQLTREWRLDVGGSSVRAHLTEAVPAQGFSAGDRLPGSPEVNANVALQYAFALGGHEAYVRADGIYLSSFYGGINYDQNTPKAGGYVKLDTSARIVIDRLSVDLYAQNLTNENDITFALGTQLSLLRPRTFGLRLGYNF